MGRASVMCVTAHGQEFSITLSFGDISVKYIYNDKNAYYYENSGITGKICGTKYVT